MPDPKQHRGHWPTLDGLRGLAFLLVFAFHLERFSLKFIPGSDQLYTGVMNILSVATGFGWAGVDLFFVLSGFLITGKLLEARESTGYFLNFYARRTLRIAPAYYFTVAVLTFVLPAAIAGDSAFRQLFDYPSWPVWTYLLNFTVGWNGWASTSALYSHYWSLCIEEQFYLVWPLLVAKLPDRVLRKVLITCVISGPVVRLLALLWLGRTASYVLLPCRADALSLGALLAAVHKRPDEWRRLVSAAPMTAVATGATVGALAWTAGGPSNETWQMLLLGLSALALFCGALVVLAVGRDDGRTRGLHWSCLRFFGKYSFGLYLMHQPLLVLLAAAGLSVVGLHRAIGSLGPAIVLMTACGLGGSILLALTSWYFVESPMLRWKKHFPTDYRSVPAAGPRRGWDVRIASQFSDEE